MERKYFLKSAALLFTVLIGLSSCQSLREQHFSRQRYTDFKVRHHEMQKEDHIAFSGKNENGVIAVKENPVTNIISRNEISPVVVSLKQVKSTPIETTNLCEQEKSHSVNGLINRHHPKKTKVLSLLKAAAQGSKDTDSNTILLVLLAILLPPLAVYLKDHATSTWFWVTFLLCIFSFSFFFFTAGYSLWFIAMIIALLHVFDVI